MKDLNLFTKEYLTEEYVNNNRTMRDIAKENNTTKNTVRRYLQKYHIEVLDKNTLDQNKYNQYKALIPKEIFIKEYETLSISEIGKKYNIPNNQIFRIFKEYDIKKDNVTYQTEKRSELKSLTKEFLYDEYINKNKSISLIAFETKHSDKSISNKLKEFNIDKISTSEKIKQTMKTKYGVENAMQVSDFLNKQNQTVMEKYGVQYSIFTDNNIHKSQGANSKPNLEFAKLLDDAGIKYEREFHISNRSYDFKIDNTLIEIDPWITHNATFGYKNKLPLDILYHKEKSDLANKNGYNCVHVFDWDNTSKIINMFKTKTTIYARKCEIKIIDSNLCNSFLIKYHLQGGCKSQKICLGLYYKNELVEVMSFGTPRYNKNYEYELLRLCTNSDYVVIGGSNKLFQYFINNYSKSIISYCDVSKFSGNIYKDLGFKLLRQNAPSKHWYNGHINNHITDNMLRQLGYDKIFGANYGKGTSNEELMKLSKYVEIYDCGQATWIYKK